MSENENKKPSESGLSWGHSALDAICQHVPEFESLLIVFRDANAFKWAGSLVRQSLIPNSARSGLQLTEHQLTYETRQSLDDKLRFDMPDALVAVCPETDRDRLNQICAQLAKAPVSVIGLFHVMPSRWEFFFDASVEIEASVATIRWRDGRPEIQVPFSSRPSEPLPASSARAVSTHASLLAIVGGDEKTETTLLKILPASSLQIRSLPFDSRELDSASLILYCDRWQPNQSEQEIRALAKKSTVFVMSATPLRVDDRVSCYRAGARLVLGPQPGNEEVAAAILSYLSPESPALDPFARLDDEYARLSVRVKRDAYWKASDVERAVPVYKKLVENHLRHARLLDAEVTALVVKLPATPKEIATTGWQNVFQKALVGTLLSTLRSRDLTLVVDDKLIVVAHAVHNMAAKPILRRMSAALEELGAKGATVEVLRRNPIAAHDLSSEAEDLVRSLFDASKMKFQSLESWLS